MKQIAATLIVLAGLTFSARGAVVVELQQSGNDLVSTGTGTLTFENGNYATTSSFDPALTFFSHFVGNSGFVDSYQLANFTGPSTVPANNFANLADSGLGDPFGLNWNAGLLAVPAFSVSGSSFSGSAIYENTSLSDLELEAGTWTWTWDVGTESDSFTLVIIPEPTSGLLLTAGLSALMLRKRSNQPLQRLCLKSSGLD